MAQPQVDVRPFEAISSDVARRVRPHIGKVAEEMLPELSDASGEQVRRRIVEDLEQFCALIEDSRGEARRLGAALLDRGRQMALDGQDLDEMHRALRRSARALWRALTSVADVLDLDRATLSLIAEAEFAYMDAVSALVAHGYETEAGGSAEALRQARMRLLTMLLADAPPESKAIADAAWMAQWTVPRTIAAVVLRPREPVNVKPPSLPPDILMDLGRPKPCLVLPDPDGPGRQRLLEPITRDWTVVIGPTLPPARAAESLQWAREAMALSARGVIPDAGLIRCADHVPSLVIFKAEALIDHAAGRLLKPLRSLPQVQAGRLTQTLLSLLENKFNANKVAGELYVHPQTVRYRLRHLEELFGDQLDDPRGRLEMEMILHAKLAASGTRGSLMIIEGCPD